MRFKKMVEVELRIRAKALDAEHKRLTEELARDNSKRNVDRYRRTYDLLVSAYTKMREECND